MERWIKRFRSGVLPGNLFPSTANHDFKQQVITRVSGGFPRIRYLLRWAGDHLCQPKRQGAEDRRYQDAWRQAARGAVACGPHLAGWRPVDDIPVSLSVPDRHRCPRAFRRSLPPSMVRGSQSSRPPLVSCASRSASSAVPSAG
jgi:hypothetical protein